MVSPGVMAGVGENERETETAADDADTVLGRVHKEHYERLVSLARLLLDRRDDAEEAVQEAFVRTYVRWDRLHTPADPVAYLRQAVVNLSRHGLRRRHHLLRPVAVESAPAADTSVVVDESRRAVAAAVGQLPRGSGSVSCCATSSTAPPPRLRPRSASLRARSRPTSTEL